MCLRELIALGKDLICARSWTKNKELGAGGGRQREEERGRGGDKEAWVVSVVNAVNTVAGVATLSHQILNARVFR